MTYQTEAVTMWFDRRLVMQASPIHGIGTFATHLILAGERLIWREIRGCYNKQVMH